MSGRYRTILRLRRPAPRTVNTDLPPIIPAGREIATDYALYATKRAWISGPYRVQSYVPQQQVVLAPNKRYRTHRGPFVARLVYKAYRPVSSLLDAAARGASNITAGYGVVDLPALRAHASLYRLVMNPSARVTGLVFNVLDPAYGGHPNPVRDVRVRQALALAVDQTTFTRQTLGLSRTAASPYVAKSPFLQSSLATEANVPRTVTGSWDPVVHRYVPYGPPAVSDAKKLLRQAGYASGLALDVVASADQKGHSPAVAFLQAAWKPLNVVVHRSDPYTGCCLQWPWRPGAVRGGCVQLAGGGRSG